VVVCAVVVVHCVVVGLGVQVSLRLYFHLFAIPVCACGCLCMRWSVLMQTTKACSSTLWAHIPTDKAHVAHDMQVRSCRCDAGCRD